MTQSQQSLPVQVVFIVLFAASLISFAYSFVGIINHVRSLSWVQIPAQLLDIYSRSEVDYLNEHTRNDHIANIGSSRRLVAKYSYEYQGKTYTGQRLSFYNNRSYSSQGDTWWTNIFEHIRSNENNFLVWVNPKDPSESVVQRDIRWFFAGIYFFLGLFGSFLFGSFLFQNSISVKPGEISPLVVGIFSVLGLLCPLVSPLLWRDRHYILSILAFTPLALAINGIRVLLKK